MRSLKAFFVSMFSEWGSTLSGPASVPFAILALLASSRTQKTAYASLAVLLGFCSAYLIFKKEHDRANRAEMLIDNQIPNLSLRVDGGIWEYQSLLNITRLWLSVTIGNGGGPSIAKGWNAHYLQGNEVIPMEPHSLSEGGETVATRTHYLELKNADLLQTKTAQLPIERRSERQGKIVFTIPGNKEKEFSEKPCSVRLTCTDFEGRSCEEIFVPNGGKDATFFYLHEDVKEFPRPRVRFLS